MNQRIAVAIPALVLLALGAIAEPVRAGPDTAADADTGAGNRQQAYGDAWWTGPLLAPSAGTMPRGHLLAETYVYDVRRYGRYDGAGSLQRSSGPHDLRSLTYALYGLTDTFTVGLIPRFGLDAGDSRTRRSAAGVGDLGIHAHYRLCAFEEGHWRPTISLVLEETLPTGRYDQLGDHPGNGIGSGQRATMYAVYTQRYFRAPNGRIVRTRLDLSYTHAGDVRLVDASVYGTRQGFRGTASPGDGTVADLAFEYSATRRWVLALDVDYEWNASTRVAGTYPAATGVAAPGVGSVQSSPRSEALYLAPAIEYSWSARFGVIAGAKISVLGHNTGAYAIPAVAINMVY
jgi:hypothetical protein